MPTGDSFESFLGFADGDKSDVFMIVGSTEADPSAKPKKLSNESPVGKALLGHKKGDEVEVMLPSGRTKSLKITKIAV